MKLDSGSVDHIIGPDTLTGTKTRPNIASRRGMKWFTADGSGIPNIGEKHAKGHSEEGHPIAMTIQVGKECTKNLASAMRL